MEAKKKARFNPRAKVHENEYLQIKDMTGKEIIAYVQKSTGVKITTSTKNKLGIIKKAIFALKVLTQPQSPPAIKIPQPPTSIIDSVEEMFTSKELESVIEEGSKISIENATRKEMIDIAKKLTGRRIGGFFTKTSVIRQRLEEEIAKDLDKKYL